MPSFDIILTRDVTESASVTVRARNAQAAKEKAMAMAEAGKLTFEVDDGNFWDDAYVTGCEESP